MVGESSSKSGLPVVTRSFRTAWDREDRKVNRRPLQNGSGVKALAANSIDLSSIAGNSTGGRKEWTASKLSTDLTMCRCPDTKERINI